MPRMRRMPRRLYKQDIIEIDDDEWSQKQATFREFLVQLIAYGTAMRCLRGFADCAGCWENICLIEMVLCAYLLCLMLDTFACCMVSGTGVTGVA